MTGRRGGFTSNTFHSTAIAEKAEGVVVDQFVTGLVEHGSGVGLSNGQTHCVGEPLAQRTRGHFDSGSVMGLRMPGSDTVDLLKHG